MLKRRAIILFSTLLLLITGYVAWCARPFFLNPPLQLTINSASGMNPDEEKVIRQWYAESELITPPDFNWQQMGEYLKRPWDDHFTPSIIIVIQATHEEEKLSRLDLIVILHGKTYYTIQGRLQNGAYEWTIKAKKEP